MVGPLQQGSHIVIIIKGLDLIESGAFVLVVSIKIMVRILTAPFAIIEEPILYHYLKAPSISLPLD